MTRIKTFKFALEIVHKDGITLSFMTRIKTLFLVITTLPFAESPFPL